MLLRSKVELSRSRTWWVTHPIPPHPHLLSPLCGDPHLLSHPHFALYAIADPRKDMPYDLEKFTTCAGALVADQLSHVVDVHYRNLGFQSAQREGGGE